MGKKGGGSPPPPPDPYATAAAQTATNKETAYWNAGLSHVDQFNPYGSLTYTETTPAGGGYDMTAYNTAMAAWDKANQASQQTQDGGWHGIGSKYTPPNYRTGVGNGPTTPGPVPMLSEYKLADKPPQFQSHVNLTPLGQQMFDAQQQQNKSINDLASGYLNRIEDTMGQGFDTSGMPALHGDIQQGQIQTSLGSPGQLQYGVDTSGLPGLDGSAQGGRIQNRVTGQQQFQDFGGNAPIQAGLNYNGLPGLPGSNDFSADGRRVAEALYGKQTSYLDPQYEKSQNQLESQLANQGIYRGSEAYTNAQDEMARSKSFDYGQARDSAILAGGQEQSRLFGLGLSARQQAQNETNTQGAFANQAQQQFYDQSLGRGTFANTARANNFSQGLQQGQFANTAQQQGFAQDLAGSELSNSARQQGLAEALSRAALQNQAVGQNYDQTLGAATFGNQATAQRFAQDTQAAQFGNAARQQAMQEQAYLRNLPINEFNALRASSQVQTPQFQGAPQGNMQPANVSGNVYQSYNAALQNYNAEQASSNDMWGSLFGLGGQLGAAWIASSDRRLKEGVRRIGTTPGGLPVYNFRYKGNAESTDGVMAQDVMKVNPAAISYDAQGYMMVNYGMVR